MESEASIDTDSFIEKCDLVNTEVRDTETESTGTLTTETNSVRAERGVVIQNGVRRKALEKRIWSWLDKQPTIGIQTVDADVERKVLIHCMIR